MAEQHQAQEQHEQTANFYFLGTDGDPQLQRALSEVQSLKN